MAHGKLKDLVAVALHDRGMQPDSWNFDFRDRCTYGRRPGCCARGLFDLSGLFDLLDFFGLICVCF